MSFQERVYFPESEQMLFRQETSLTPGSVEDRTGMTLERERREAGGERERERERGVVTRIQYASEFLLYIDTLERTNRSLERCLGCSTAERVKKTNLVKSK